MKILPEKIVAFAPQYCIEDGGIVRVTGR